MNAKLLSENRDFLAFMKGFNIFVGVAMVISSLAFALLAGKDFFAAFRYTLFPLWIPLPFIGSFTFYYVYTISITIIGAFIIVFDRRHGWRGLPLMVMCAGLFDVILSSNAGGSLMAGSPWPLLQSGMAVGGWLVSGRPSFDFNSRWFWLPLGALVGFNYGLDYHVFEVGLYLFVLFAVRHK